MWIEERATNKGTQYIYYERYSDPVTGKNKRVSISLKGNTPRYVKEATRLLQEKISRKLDSIEQDKYITLHQVAYMWLEHTRPTVKLSTHVNHGIYVKKIDKYIPNDLPIIRVTPVMIERLVNGVYYVENLSYHYSKSLLTSIKAIFRYAKRRGLLNNIQDIEDIKLIKKPFSVSDIAKKQNKFLDNYELKEALQQIYKIEPRISLLFEFISLTGLRIGELLALRYCDYNKEKATININGTLQYHCNNSSDFKRGTPKNIYSVRDIKLCKRSIRILERIITENKRNALWFTGYKENGYIFTAKRGNPYNMQYLNKILKRVQVNNKNLTTHIFRHTHISILSELGVPLKAIMQRVGHNDPTTTLSIYTHVTQAMNEDVINKLNARNG
ncbi:tyrosine-type recombinase/integrase [Veillonella caviae]|uniref:tyrosine-type recombinase/integrase n=1 Tax=Veillonella caviae TaxID=248316 RepID=UPI0023A7C0D2|nr:site-specific integrase [Veillonella caviae]MCI5708967.1 site-specific integrase [Veillonella caviae]MCI6407678.1 site-specific integrase [Veillonella caviae]MDY5714956.1 site-specific integrase [Veillonella caviae]MDY6225790.1 site-specific integrase [Veillonella caviae]